MDAQLGLFPGAVAPAPPARVGPARPDPRVFALADSLPPGLRLGTSSWSFPGWEGTVYDRAASQATLARHGLSAYASHPLLRTVCIDRTYYRPVPAAQLRTYADSVPDDFRFIVKADRAITSPIDPEGYGVRTPNPRFLDAAHAVREVIEPALAGLGAKAGPIVFQFPPIPASLLRGSARFVERLHRFLDALPKGPRYAVELRTRAFLTDAYAQALEATGAVHCYNVHPAMASLERQLGLLPPFYQPVLLVRWMLHDGLTYESATARYEPFDRIVDDDATSRDTIAVAALDVLVAERDVFIIANNKAEGSAPLSVANLAQRIAEWDRRELAVAAHAQ
jgi:uncharacterized protein YecE (DUF72 family)